MESSGMQHSNGGGLRLSFAEHELKVGPMSPERRRELLADGVCSVSPEAEDITGLKKSKLYELMQRGDLPYCKIGGARRIPRRALIELLDKCLVVKGA